MKCIDPFDMADYIGHLPPEAELHIRDHMTQCGVCMENHAGAVRILEDEDLSTWKPLTEEEPC